MSDKKQILIAEDSDNDAALLQLAIKEAGAINPVYVVRDGEEAIAYLNGDGPYSDRERFPIPCVFFLDLKMPKVDGFQVLEWLQSQPSYMADMLVIVLSGFAERTNIHRAYLSGADSFLVKPCERKDIVYLYKYFYGRWMFR